MTDSEEADGLAAAGEGAAEAATPQSNFERLQTYLKADSLAEKLVAAYAVPGEDAPTQAMHKVMAARLDELKKSYGAPEDQQN